MSRVCVDREDRSSIVRQGGYPQLYKLYVSSVYIVCMICVECVIHVMRIDTGIP